MVTVENLSKDYGGKLALDRLSFEARPGEILGFLGPNGAGKSTTVKILTGLLTQTEGRALICGFDVSREPLETKKRIGYVPEMPALFESLTADDFINVIGALHHLDQDAVTARATELFELFDLTASRFQRLAAFSKGMKQKTVLIAALLHQPEVLILDEPLDGLDANSAMVVKDLLKQLAAEGKTVIFSSHILDVVERVCTRILILDKGRKIAEGTVAEICGSAGAPRLEEAFRTLTGRA
jgi:ABC-2 type transport system ATP-binding protein